MGIRHYKPTTPGRRGASVSDFAEITDRKKKPEKSLLRKVKKKAGRNNQGKITVRHRGGGHKKRYRLIDFKRNKDQVPAKVAFIEYDPNRSARIALLHYADGEKRYILAPDGLQAGDTVQSGEGVEPNVGNAMPLSRIPPGTVELKRPLVLTRDDVRIEGSGTATHLVNRNEEGQPAVILRPANYPTDRRARMWRVQKPFLGLSPAEEP